MTNEPSTAQQLFDSGRYEKALWAFANNALDLLSTEGEEAMEKIERSLEMTISAYEAINPRAVMQIKDLAPEDLWDQFYQVMRHYMDFREENDPLAVEEELSRKIRLGIPEERLNIYPEGENALVEAKAGPYSAAVMKAQGPREEMEDEHLATELALGNHRMRQIPCFAVLDGHGGGSCAYYVRERLPGVLEDELRKVQLDSDQEVYNALRKSFIRIDREWSAHPSQQSGDANFSGTTATVALFLGTDLWVANVGDSRTVLVEDGYPVQLSEEAKATVPKYIREIYLRGGTVHNGRVVGDLGTLDMARSIGDIDQPSVSALPTLKKFSLEGLKEGKNWLILGCDGLWDVVSPQLAAEICSMSRSVQDAARKLEQAAFLCGTTDNVTVMVIALSS